MNEKISELQGFIASRHKPECRERSMVWQVWEDGEVTLTKGGELWGLRSLHMMQGGHVSPFPLEVMPVQETRHSYAIVESEEVANEIRTAMRKAQE